MSGLKELSKKWMAKAGAHPETCGVVNCQMGNAEVVELLPFDPIDHDSTLIQLCPDHQVWADERNEFAEEMLEELREERKRIGQNNIARIQELSTPQDGKLREDILMGDVDEPAIPLSEAMEGDK